MFDKSFKIVPCYFADCPADTFENGWNATFYLISLHMAWCGPITATYWCLHCVLVHLMFIKDIKTHLQHIYYQLHNI